MMRSCGICFVHRRWRRDAVDDDEYIAPDLLPDRTEIQAELDAMWDFEAPTETAEFDYPLLHSGVVTNIISRIGAEAGSTALYWRGGLCVYETSTRSRALIEGEMLDEWRGRIRLGTQRGHAAELLRRLSAIVEQENDQMGVRPATVAPQRPAPGVVGTEGEREKQEKARPLQFAEEPRSGAEYFVSYAWGDATAEGRQREAVVDRLCAAAGERGIAVLRDKTALGVGDSISKFMQRIGRGDRIFVILSDKYLRSPYCMYELLEIWRKSEAEQEKFLERVRVYVLPETKIFKLADRAQYAIHWQDEYEAVHKLVRERGANVLGARGFREFKLMQDFHRWVAEILETVADRLQPRDFDELVKSGLADLASG
jgi:internalin A